MGSKYSNRTVTMDITVFFEKVKKNLSQNSYHGLLAFYPIFNHLATAILAAWLKSNLLYISKFQLNL